MSYYNNIADLVPKGQASEGAKAYVQFTALWDSFLERGPWESRCEDKFW